jgi:hypothetical protein
MQEVEVVVHMARMAQAEVAEQEEVVLVYLAQAVGMALQIPEAEAEGEIVVALEI